MTKLENDKQLEKKKMFANILLVIAVISLFIFLYWMRSEGGKCAMNPLNYIKEKNPDWGIMITGRNMIIKMNESEVINNEWAKSFNATGFPNWLS